MSQHARRISDSREEQRICSRFCKLLQVTVPGAQQGLHIPGEEEDLSDSPEKAQRSPEGENVNHERPWCVSHKFMRMMQVLEYPRDHLIGKTRGAFVRGNFRRQMLLDTKMHSFPG